MTNRRRVLLAMSAALAMPGSALGALGAIEGELAEIERESGGRLGVAILDTATSRRAGLRSGERFPLCSTFKLLASGAVLSRVDAGREDLERRIRFEAKDVVTYSPVTKDRVGGDGMTLADLCDAALTRGDNTAGNLILASIGGPPGFTAFTRTLDDPMTRLDRIEPALNEAAPGDPRDTTTPDAMLADIHALVLGEALSAESRTRLTAWLVANTTGATRLRAGFPEGWRIGDKTGAGARGTTNDVAVIWPPGRAPIIVCVYLTDTSAPTERRNATVAAVGRVVATMVKA